MAQIKIKLGIIDGFSSVVGKFFSKMEKMESNIDKVAGKSAPKSIKETGKAADSAGLSALGFGAAIQKLYYGMQVLERFKEPVKQAIDEISSRMEAVSLYGEKSGNALIKFSEDAANAMGRTTGEVKSAALEFAKLGASGKDIRRLTEVTDRFAKFDSNNFSGMADKFKSAIKDKNISSVADTLGGGQAVETMLKRAGMERALNRGDVQGALDIYEKVADKLGYTKEKADQINETLGNKLLRVWNMIQNKVMKVSTMLAEKLEPVVDQVVSFIQSPEVQNAIDNAVEGVGLLVDKIFDAVQAIRAFAKNNPELVTMGSHIAGVALGVVALSKGFQVARIAALGLGKAVLLLASPVAVITTMLVGTTYLFQSAMESMTGETVSFVDAVIGIIVGGGVTLLGTLANLVTSAFELFSQPVEMAVDQMAGFVNYFANCFNDPIGAIYHAFADLAKGILSTLESIANGINRVFGSETIGNFTGYLNGLQKDLDGWADGHGNGTYKAVMKTGHEFLKDFMPDRVDVTKSAADAIESVIGKKNELAGKLPGFIREGMFGGNSPLNKIVDSLDDMQGNTKKIATSVKHQQDLRWMKELAEREFTSYVNVRTMQPNVNMTVNNNGRDLSEKDIERAMANVLTEQASAGSMTYHGEL